MIHLRLFHRDSLLRKPRLASPFERLEDRRLLAGIDEDLTPFNELPMHESVYFSTSKPGAVEGSDGSLVEFDDSDIIRLNIERSETGEQLSHEYFLFFDGSDVGLTSDGEDIDALAILEDGSIVVSTAGRASVPGLTGRDEDLLLFTPAPNGLGSATAGSWSLFFDGSDTGLSDKSEDTDAVALLPDGRLVISTKGDVTVNGLAAHGEDLLAFRPFPGGLGKTTSGTWSLFLAGSNVGLDSSGERINAADVEGSALVHLSTTGSVRVPAIKGRNEDIITFERSSETFAPARRLDGSTVGLGPYDIDAFHLQREEPELPNFVVINTDDQRADMLPWMPIVNQELVQSGTSFSESFVTTSLCCPSRVSLFTGQYVHTHGVHNNSGDEGGFANFNDSQTIATLLHDAGYRTGLYGKYVNGYDGSVRPGWDEFHAPLDPRYYDYIMSENGTFVTYGSAPEDYSTDVLARKAVDFIHASDATEDQPFFLYLAPAAPHKPAVPAPRHLNEFADIEPYRPPSFNESDIQDKPTWVQTPLLTDSEIAELDELRRKMFASLLAVDEAVGDIMDTLRETGELENTVVLYTSDNGQMWGTHRQVGKKSPYEESIRVPLVIRDGRNPVAQTTDALALNIDLAPTLLDLAGVTPPVNTDGKSLAPMLHDPADSVREDFLIEHWSNVGSEEHQALRTEKWLYVEYLNGERELYDLENDPYQLSSLHDDPQQAALMQTLSSRLRQLLDGQPVITQSNFNALGVEAEGKNITGPSVIRVPDWIAPASRPDPQAQYYMYFAHAKGDYVRMAWAKNLQGPWQLYQVGSEVAVGNRGVLDLGPDDTIDLDHGISIARHVASPDVHVDDANQQIVMYFQGDTIVNGQPGRDKTFVATSADGLNFNTPAGGGQPGHGVRPVLLGDEHFRVFDYQGDLYAIADGGTFYQARDSANPWTTPAGFDFSQELWIKRQQNPFAADLTAAGLTELQFRHAAVRLIDDNLEVYYSRIGDAPERILRSAIDLSVGDMNLWDPSFPPAEIKRPEAVWEGINEPVEPSTKGIVNSNVQQLRDPFVFIDTDGQTYLFYAGRGEDAIGFITLD